MKPHQETRTLTAVVLGLGRIGSAFDHAAATGTSPRTHLGAMLAAEAFGRVFAVDPDPARREAAGRRWNADAITFFADPHGLARIDVAALCTPAQLRLEALVGLMNSGTRIVVIEKPLALSIDEGERIVRLASDAGAEVRVNFHRRFDPGIQAARAALGEGFPHMVVMRYGKGLYNYASHHVDLLLDWFGGVESVQAIGSEIAGDGDPTLSFRCRMAAGFDAVVLGMCGLDYDQFEIDVFSADRRLELVSGGVEKRLYRPVADQYYAGYSHLGEPLAAAPSGQVSGFGELYSAIVAHLRDGKPLPGCTGAEALAGMRVLDAARRSAAQGGIVIQLEHDECHG
jgi:scyllo-inositol 2-dehydrogenase (NADP+)